MIKKYTTGTLYKLIEPAEEDAFVYVREIKSCEIAFSVLPYAAIEPIFSNCSIFRINKNDFESMFIPYVIN